jgi:hypothetical protein
MVATVGVWFNGGTGEGMEADDLLCSRNARSRKEGKGSLVVLLLAERAQSRIDQPPLKMK